MKNVYQHTDPKYYVSRWSTEIEKQLLTESTDTAYRYFMKEHVHQFYEILFCYSSCSLRHSVAGRTHDTDSPFILFRAPYILHATNGLDDRPYTRTSIGFHPCVLAEFGGICHLGRLANCWECVIPTTTEKLMELKPLLNRLAYVRDPYTPKRVWLSALAVLLWEVSQMAENAVIHDTEAPPYIQELLRYVAEHAEGDLSGDVLAEKFFVSRAKLMRDFRAAIGLPLHEYVTSIRIHRAKILLADNLPLSLIAQECGFGSDSAFISMFRRHMGMTPGNYRKSLEKK